MVNIALAQTLADFQAVRGLLDEMAAWDAQETRAQGYDTAALLADGYGDSAEDLRAHFTASGSAMFVVHHDGRLVGSAGYCDAGAGMAEVEKVYVRPDCRGLGLGSTLLSAIMVRMVQDGYTSARLETANFMHAAQVLYRRFGFAEIAAFRPSLGATGDMSVFMGCDLQASRTA